MKHTSFITAAACLVVLTLSVAPAAAQTRGHVSGGAVDAPRRSSDAPSRGGWPAGTSASQDPTTSIDPTPIRTVIRTVTTAMDTATHTGSLATCRSASATAGTRASVSASATLVTVATTGTLAMATLPTVATTATGTRVTTGRHPGLRGGRRGTGVRQRADPEPQPRRASVRGRLLRRHRRRLRRYVPAPESSGWRAQNRNPDAKRAADRVRCERAARSNDHLPGGPSITVAGLHHDGRGGH